MAKAETSVKQKDKKKFSPKRMVENVSRYFRELRSEFKKIVWPTRKQVVNNTLVVIAVCLVIGACIWIIDGGLSLLIGLLYK